MTKKEAFVNWGFVNGWTPEIYKQFEIAEKLHNKDMEEHPELHNFDVTDTPTGWHERNCSCGFCWGCDSGD